VSTIIIITPPTKPQADADGFAQERLPMASPYTEAMKAIERAELDGATVRIIES
jgi:hypothetical protein